MLWMSREHVPKFRRCDCEMYHKRLTGIHLGSQIVRTMAEMAMTAMATNGSQPST